MSYTDPTSFATALAGHPATNINFAAAVDNGENIQGYFSPTGLSLNGVSFVGNITGGSNYLYAITPAYFPTYQGWNGNPVVLQGPGGSGSPNPGELDITLPSGTTAVGFNVYGVFFATGGSTTLDVKLSTGDVYTVPTTTQPFLSFIGFTSSVPITSLSVTGENGAYPNLSNFTVATVPEPSSISFLVVIGLGLGLLVRRRARVKVIS